MKHLQLRNLLWATSKHDVYLVQNYSVMHWSPLFQRGREVLNVAGPLAPTEVSSLHFYFYAITLNCCNFQLEYQSLNLRVLPPVQNVKGARPLSRVQISTMALKDNLMVAGGFQGELICKV